MTRELTDDEKTKLASGQSSVPILRPSTLHHATTTQTKEQKNLTPVQVTASSTNLRDNVPGSAPTYHTWSKQKTDTEMSFVTTRKHADSDREMASLLLTLKYGDRDTVPPCGTSRKNPSHACKGKALPKFSSGSEMEAYESDAKHSASFDTEDNLTVSEFVKQSKNEHISLPRSCKKTGKLHVREVTLKKPRGKQPKTVFCTLCSAHFPNQDQLNAHVEAHHGKFSCLHPGCGLHLQSAATLREHIHLHSKGVYECDECGKLFHWKSKLDKHMVCHSNECKHVCPNNHCSQKFKQKDALHQHLISHVDERIYCNEKGCSYSTTLDSHIKDHQDGVHGPPYYECDTCKKRFKYRSGFGHHVESCSA